jgi:ribosomal protein S18 acetylase RimI-like enzyme
MDRNNIELRAFNGSAFELDELIAMFVELMLNFSGGYKEINRATTVNELFKMLNINGSFCYLMIMNHKIAGFVLMFPDGKGGLTAQNLFIKEEYRKSKLFHTVINLLEKNVDESHYLYCDAIITNDVALSLYEKRGYKKQYCVYRYQK